MALTGRTADLRGRAPDALKRRGRRVAVGAGKVTAGARVLPDFIVAGAQRAGTTSLHRALRTHPQIVPPVLHKGVHYFDVDYGKGMRWYRAHFPIAAVARRRADGEPVAFESSGYYMHHPLAPGRIAADLPGVRIVLMLRDPVERAYSAHRHELARGFETVEFEEALELEPARLEGEVERLVADPTYVSHAHRHHSYVDRSRYAPQVARLLDLFGRDRIHVVWSEDFYEQPADTYAALLDFLGLPVVHPRRYEQWNARPRSPMPDAVRARLEASFEPDDEELSRMLGERPSWRR